MKRYLIIVMIIILALVGFVSCAKKMAVEDYPNVIFGIDLTPGEKEKEIAVFLYTSKEDVTYEIKKKGYGSEEETEEHQEHPDQPEDKIISNNDTQDKEGSEEKTQTDTNKNDKNPKYLILDINNSVKPGKAAELKIDGLEDLIEKARIVPIVQVSNKKNPFVTRLIFNVIDPETTLKIIIQVRKVDVQKVENSISSSDAAKAIAITVSHGSPDYSIWFIIALWFFCIGGLVVYWIFKKA